jgi:hypothetical protein
MRRADVAIGTVDANRRRNGGVTRSRDRFGASARRLGAEVRSHVVDGTGWRWRVSWRGIEMGAWNDIDGVAVVADVGPWDEWLGLSGSPPDPSAVEALEWAVAALDPWIAVAANADRIAERTSRRADER